MDKKEERFIRELDRRTALWEKNRDGAKERVELGKPLAKRELDIAERALIRITKKKDELLGVPLDDKPDVEYSTPTEVLEKDMGPMEEAPKKRVHKRPKALFELAPVKDVEVKEEHDA